MILIKKQLHRAKKKLILMYKRLTVILPYTIAFLFIDKDHRKLYEDLQKKIHEFSSVGKKIIVGDFSFAFVLLQYKHHEITRDCVVSLLERIKGTRFSIIIVDNGSDEDTVAATRTISEMDERIHFLPLPENRGFARGNNAGYRYAKEKLSANWIIVMNNDVFIQQANFLGLIREEFAKTSFSILGPDVCVFSEKIIHQNPLGYSLETKTETEAYITKTTRQLASMENNTFSFDQPSPHGRTFKEKRRLQGFLTLHGSIYIFSPLFVLDFDEPFDPRTFLYGEENILSLRAIARGHKIVYTPKIQVEHRTKSSTNTKDIPSYYFNRYKLNLESAKIYLELLEEIQS